MKRRTYYLAAVFAGVVAVVGYFYRINYYPSAEDYRLANKAVSLLRKGDVKECKKLGDNMFSRYLDIDIDDYPSQRPLLKDVGTAGGAKGIWSRWAKKYGGNLQISVTNHPGFCVVSDEKGLAFFNIGHTSGDGRYLTRFFERTSDAHY